ncbi:hypothetical protein NLG97_g27 [Lecanicillium saksenae]|uniref:Uncharacterized protein n=1 Tax=Lecanicillium saksenae TaxID=468837 RepID=A0ACC1RAB6_9HYPO|nr:hypothetical protein NLG97_g27 [Lecanicillium saksenae]
MAGVNFNTPGVSAPPAAPATLRRSCIFCRARKIRCSGGHVCSACRERNINCVYGPESRKGRPKRKQTADTEKQIKAAPALPLVCNANADAGSSSVPTQSPQDDARSPGPAQTLEQELDNMFSEYFIRKSGSHSNLFQNSIAAFHRSMEQSPQAQTGPRQAPQLTYDGLLSFLAHDMVEMLLRFGQLGYDEPPGPSCNFYISNLASDTTPTMFDTPLSGANPLQSFGKYIIIQIVDLWFSLHPLSMILSKTLLISAVKDETVDPALLAIVLADTSQSHVSVQNEAARGNADSESLVNLAATLLGKRTLPLAESERMPTAQALMLLGWREMCKGKVRRATCFIGYTCRIVSQIQKSWGDRSTTDEDAIKLNGISISNVNREILRNIYWLCLSTTTWTFMQIHQPFSLLLPHEVPEFPCADETSSILIELDKASSNISTLQAQIRNMQWLWPLSHITSTVAYTYTLFLNATKLESSPRHEPASWQTQHIHELHRLPQACMDPLMLSRQIRRILLQSIQDVEREVTNFTSQSFLLAAYHTIAIQMIFFEQMPSEEDLFVLPSIFQPFKHSASALLDVAQRSPPPLVSPVSLSCLLGAGRADAGRTVALGLDTASRALVEIHRLCNLCQGDSNDSIKMLQSQLGEFARAIHRACRTDHLMRCGSAIQPIKKRLKHLQRSLASGRPVSPGTTTDGSGSTYATGSSEDVDTSTVHVEPAPWPSLGLSPLPDLPHYTMDTMESGFTLSEPLDFGSLFELPGFYEPVPSSGPSVDSRTVSVLQQQPHEPLFSPQSIYNHSGMLLTAIPRAGDDPARVQVQTERQNQPLSGWRGADPTPSEYGSSDSSVSPQSERELAVTQDYDGQSTTTPSWIQSTAWPSRSTGVATKEVDVLFRQ